MEGKGLAQEVTNCVSLKQMLQTPKDQARHVHKDRAVGSGGDDGIQGHMPQAGEAAATRAR